MKKYLVSGQLDCPVNNKSFCGLFFFLYYFLYHARLHIGFVPYNIKCVLDKSSGVHHSKLFSVYVISTAVYMGTLSSCILCHLYILGIT